MNKIDCLLVYPQLGSWDSFVKDIPLSLIYAASHSVKNGYNVKILDLRSSGSHWQNDLDLALHDGCCLVGISVMTGNPINTSLEISRYVKAKYALPVVWGGPHPTILPEQTLQNDAIDYVVRDWGSKALWQLIEHLKAKNSQIESIIGLGYKNNGLIHLNAAQSCFEMLDFHDLPYHLVDISGEKYNRLQNGELIFPIYTSMGCPYKCTFCMSPAVYKKIKGKKWIAHDVEYVLEHIDFLSKRYTFSRLQIYDDDSFVDINRMRRFLEGFIEKGFHHRFKIDFRGARINELDKMNEAYLELMVSAGVEMMFIGMESGSPNVLKKMQKGITVDQILRVNRKLARFPQLKPHYNFFCGIPGETLQDLIMTKEVLVQLVKDNPRCYLGRGGHWKPIPGSVLSDVAQKDFNLVLPTSLEGWAAFDSRDAQEICHPWYTEESKRFIDLLKITGLALDSKSRDFSDSFGPVAGRLIFLLSRMYLPILHFRLHFNYTGFFIENRFFDLFLRHIGTLLRLIRKITLPK